MVYESQISFTMDIICPWTYIAKKRINQALDQFRSSAASADVVFTLKYFPYQLYPEMSAAGQDKYEWYQETKHGNSAEQMEKFVTLMSAYGAAVGVDFNRFRGTIANTLDTHRLIQFVQEEGGAEAADKVVDALYESYHSDSAHPSAVSTLQAAARSASVKDSVSSEFFDSPETFLRETKALLREQVSNGVDGVPLVVFEGRKRDFTLQGAREVGEYLDVLRKVARES